MAALRGINMPKKSSAVEPWSIRMEAVDFTANQDA